MMISYKDQKHSRTSTGPLQPLWKETEVCLQPPQPTHPSYCNSFSATGHTPTSRFFCAHNVHCLFIIDTGLILCQANDGVRPGNTQSDEQALCFQGSMQENSRKKVTGREFTQSRVFSVQAHTHHS